MTRLLGQPGFKSLPSPAIELQGVTETGGIRQTRLQIAIRDRRIPGVLVAPAGPGPFPGVLYCHAHGNRYDIGKAEVLTGRAALMSPPLGQALAQAGHMVLCIDMPGFGDRQGEGTEAALTKAALWQGRSLLGDMLRDQALAYQALRSLPQVRSGRIATVGISMGATLAYALAALVPGISRSAHLCAFAQMGPLITAQAHDLHGIYMVIPGLLPDFDMADIAALVAPRPQLICTGLADPLTPPEAYQPAVAHLRAAYQAASVPHRLRLVTNPQGGHTETPAFRAALIRFLSEPSGTAHTRR